MRQFWAALRAAPTRQDLERLEQVLSPSLIELFLRQQPSEQYHSLQVYERLLAQGERAPELLTAALLHDVGKSRAPLRPWERAVVVLVNALAPGLGRRWGEGEPHGWRRPFVVAAQHPAWGAELARQAGAAPLTVRLIRRHQDALRPGGAPAGEDRLLFALQSLDDNS